MAEEHKLPYTAREIEERLRKAGEIPATTEADAGKFLRVGADGRLVAEAVINGMEVAY